MVAEAKPAPPPVEETFHLASGPITPSRLRIPAIGVDASVGRVGLLRDGSMGVPDNLWISGWLSSSARPGQAGSSVTRVASLDLSVESQVQVFGHTSQQQLVLVTCFGQYSGTSRTYDHRLVVFSRLLPPSS